jgi:MraZ protein
MLLGTYEHFLDSKNRLNLPSKFRNKLTDNVVLSKGFDGCLELRSSENFTIYANKLMSYSSNKSTNRLVTRELLANATEISIDSNGRILLPANLIKEASIKKEIVIIGLGNKIEI